MPNERGRWATLAFCATFKLIHPHQNEWHTIKWNGRPAVLWRLPVEGATVSCEYKKQKQGFLALHLGSKTLIFILLHKLLTVVSMHSTLTQIVTFTFIYVTHQPFFASLMNIVRRFPFQNRSRHSLPHCVVRMIWPSHLAPRHRSKRIQCSS